MRLTKEEFCTAVDHYEEMCAQEDTIVNALGGDFEWKPSEWIGSYYSLLTQMCDLDETLEYGTDLDYYCYELDFGRKWKPGMITIDGKDIPCRNAEELWNMIMLSPIEEDEAEISSPPNLYGL